MLALDRSSFVAPRRLTQMQIATNSRATAVVACSSRRTALSCGILLGLGAQIKSVQARPPGIVSVNKGKFGERDVLTTTTGIKYAVDFQGKGDVPKSGDLVLVEVTGELADGTVFLDTKAMGAPLAFQLGTTNKYITQGLAQVVETMRGGGRSLAAVPPSLGYATNAISLQQGAVPPNSDLFYTVELLRCQTFTLGLACCSDKDFPCLKKQAPADPSAAPSQAAASS